MQRAFLLVAAVLVISAFVLACGSEDSGGSPSGGGAAGAPVGAAGAPAIGAADPVCMAEFTAQGQSAECASCACTMCAAEASALNGGGVADFAQKAQAVVTCGRTNCCAGTACYCGADLASCLMAPAGPCVTEIEAAAGGTGIVGVMTPCTDATNACGAAAAFGRCLTGDAATMVVGKCPACTPTCM